MRTLSTREKLILSGLFLSKFDEDGLKVLGFSGFSEAFNVLALSLKASPASLKNYRDEFDPYFPNPRRGWHKRAIRTYCKNLMDEFGSLDIEVFATLIKTVVSISGDVGLVEEQTDPSASSSFARRLVTGQAAEKYFERIFRTVPQFCAHDLTNTTGLGCGFDYKMSHEEDPFLAVEVKGMTTSTGQIQLTSKEHKVARFLKDRFFLFVVRSFSERPFHTVFQDPLNSSLVFDRRESVTVQVSWTTSIGR